MKARTKNIRPPSRVNKRHIEAFVDDDVYKAFKILAIEQTATAEVMLCKALALLFDNYGKPIPPPLAQKVRTLDLA